MSRGFLYCPSDEYTAANNGIMCAHNKIGRLKKGGQLVIFQGAVLIFHDPMVFPGSPLKISPVVVHMDKIQINEMNNVKWGAFYEWST